MLSTRWAANSCRRRVGFVRLLAGRNVPEDVDDRGHLACLIQDRIGNGGEPAIAPADDVRFAAAAGAHLPSSIARRRGPKGSGDLHDSSGRPAPWRRLQELPQRPVAADDPAVGLDQADGVLHGVKRVLPLLQVSAACAGLPCFSISRHSSSCNRVSSACCNSSSWVRFLQFGHGLLLGGDLAVHPPIRYSLRRRWSAPSGRYSPLPFAGHEKPPCTSGDVNSSAGPKIGRYRKGPAKHAPPFSSRLNDSLVGRGRLSGEKSAPRRINTTPGGLQKSSNASVASST